VVESQDALIEMYKHLKGLGITVEAAFDHGMTRSLYILDPEGNAIEIYCEVPEYDWRTNDDFVGYLKPIDIEALAAS
jgi:catechol 2,3-dioxygenase